MIFLSTLSLRRATCQVVSAELRVFYFYPRSPCGERLHYDNYNLHCVEISIHALLAESDQWEGMKSLSEVISIHALLAESDFGPISMGFIGGSFLSTLSLRRATIGYTVNFHAKTGFLSTLSLRRATSLRQLQSALRRNFYPRSPCGERQCMPSYSPTRCYFYPRSPCGERPG